MERKLGPRRINLDDVWSNFDQAMNNIFVGSPVFQPMQYPNLNNQDSYPPYNIWEDDVGYTIEMAVAGFKKDNISVEILNNVLTVRGRVQEKSPNSLANKKFKCKMLAEREFTRTFLLQEGLKPKSTKYENGLLVITFDKIIKPENQVQKLTIE